MGGWMGVGNGLAKRAPWRRSELSRYPRPCGLYRLGLAGASRDSVDAGVEGFFVFGGAGCGQRFDAGVAQRAIFVAHAHVAVQEVQERDFRAPQSDAGAARPYAMNRAAGAEGQRLG